MGVQLPSLGVGVSMPAAAASAGSVVDDAGVLYPNIATDTDGLVTPLANGVELLALLRSPLSPEQFRYHLKLPAGEQLVAAGGGAQIVRCRVVVATLAPAVAWDAQGESVATSMSVEGSDVVVSVSHRGRDVAYPIRLDPTVRNGVNMSFASASNSPLITGTQMPSLTAAAGAYAGGELASEDWSTFSAFPGYHITYAEIAHINMTEPADNIFQGSFRLYCDDPAHLTAGGGSVGNQTDWAPFQGIGPLEGASISGCGSSGPHGVWFGFEALRAGTVTSAYMSVGEVYLVLDNGPVDTGTRAAVTPPASDVPGSRSDSNHAPTCNKGAPINCATGNEWEQDRDLAVPGRGLGLAWERTYNSMFAGAAGVDAGNLAPGWSTTYSAHLDINATSGQVVVHGDNGGTATFTPAAGGSFTAAAWVTSTLTRNADGTYTYALSDQTVEKFDAAGVLRSVTDRNRYATTLAYSSGLLQRATDPAGRSLTFSYTSGRLARATDPAGRSVSYTYDAVGNLASVTDVGGGVTRYAYDTASRLKSVTDPLGHATTTAYDAQGRAISQTDPAGATTTFAYESDPPVYNQTTITDPDGRVTIDHFNGTLLTSKTLAAGTPQQMRFVYDYNAAGEVIAQRDQASATTTMTYDAAGNLTSLTDPLQRTTTVSYNTRNEPVTVSDPAHVTTTYTYDPAGNLTDVQTPLAGASQVAETRLAYDPNHPGDLVSSTDPTGRISRFAYNQNGDLASQADSAGDVTTYTYDQVGRLQSETAPRGNAAGGNPAAFTTRVTRDAFERPTAITDPLGDKTLAAYDAAGNTVSQTDANGNTTTFAYDPADRLVQTTRADGAQTQSAYDGAGNRTSFTDGKGHITTYVYDARGELVKQTDALGRATRYGYDQTGNRTSVTDANGKTTAFTFDAAHQLTAIAYNDPATPDVSFGYDADGRRDAMTDGVGHSQWDYDSLGRLTLATTPGPLQRVAPEPARSTLLAVAGTEQLAYSYDLAGRLTQTLYPGQLAGIAITGTGTGTTVSQSGRSLTRAYDTAGRLKKITDFNGAPITYSYDADGNTVSQTDPNSTATTLAYDNADQLTRTTVTGPRGTILDLPYTRDRNGQVTATTATPATSAANETYTYDQANRLTSARLPTPTGATIQRNAFAYDAADRLTQLATLGVPVNLQYDAADQLTTATGPTGTTGATTFSYDQNGNRTQAQKATPSLQASYTYDQANDLTGYHGPLANAATPVSTATTALTTAAYHYYGDGLRADMRWDRSQGLPLIAADPTHTYITGPDGLPVEQINAAGQVRYYHHDQLGSTRALTNQAGLPVAYYDYNPYGATLHTTGTITDNPFAYAGQYTDPYNGLIYMRARNYDPTTGQFTTRDPLEVVTAEPYAYANNTPANLVDPTGLLSWPSWSDITSAGITVSNVARGALNAVTLGASEWIARHLCAAAPGQAFGTGNTLGIIASFADGEGEIAAAADAVKGEGEAAKIFFGHGARHLAGTGLAREEVETAIERQIRASAQGATVRGWFGGRVTVGGKTIEYRGYGLEDGRINAGTYFPPQ